MAYLKSHEIFGGTSPSISGRGDAPPPGGDAHVSKWIFTLIEAVRLHVRCCRSMLAASRQQLQFWLRPRIQEKSTYRKDEHKMKYTNKHIEMKWKKWTHKRFQWLTKHFVTVALPHDYPCAKLLNIVYRARRVRELARPSRSKLKMVCRQFSTVQFLCHQYVLKVRSVHLMGGHRI